MKRKPLVPSVDLALLETIRAAVRNRLMELLNENEIPTIEEGLYVLGVFTRFDWHSPSLALYFNTTDSLSAGPVSLSAEDLAELGLTPEDVEMERAPLNEKWAPAEWGVSEVLADEAVMAAYTAYNIDPEADDDEHDRQVAALNELMLHMAAAAILALRDLDQKGAWGNPALRSQLTLLGSEMNDEEWLEDMSLTAGVRFLNDESTATAFLRDWTQVIGIDESVDDWIRQQTAAAQRSALQAFLTQGKA